mgnify:CR=1 FL=1
MVSLIGANDANLRAIEAAFPSVNITVRGNEITLRGPHIDCIVLEKLFAEMMVVIRSGQVLTVDAVKRSIVMLGQEPAESPAEVLSLNIVSNRGRTIRPKTANQKKYVDAIDENTITFGIGPAGTGKTYLAMAKAVAALQAKKVNRIILTRPAVEAGEKLGFLPGTLSEKIDPFLRPLFDALHDIQDGGLQFAKLNPESQVSAFFIGLKERSSVFSVRRQIDALPDANLMAVMPGVALDDLWSTMEVAENALLLMALGVLITTILGITATLLVSLQSRRRELAIFRALGVKPYQLLSLILIEAFLVCLSGIILGWFVLQGLIYASADYLRKEWGVVSELGLPTPDDLLSLLYLVIIVLLFAGIPAIKAYRMALNDGLNPPS